VSVALYGTVAVNSFRRFATYRAATVAGLITNVVFGFIMCYTYMALWDQRPRLGGYNLPEALTFVWLGQAFAVTMSLLGNGFQDEFVERITTGDVVIDLYRPIDLQFWWFATDFGRAIFHLLSRGIAPLLVGALFFPLAIPHNPAVWGWFFLSVFLGVIVSFAIQYIVALTAFWFMENSGMKQIAMVLRVFFSGMTLPLSLFPGWLGSLAHALPWSSLLQIPADVLLEKRTGTDLAAALFFQLGWAFALVLAGRGLSLLATKKVVVQGG
jgi:ABC-2 type transport system permease protein